MNKLIIFDFNRTLFDPEKGELINGALAILSYAQAQNYLMVLLSQAAASRDNLIAGLGLGRYFSDIHLVEYKSDRLLTEIEQKYQPDKANSYVIGDRMNREIYIGHKAGWQTIWFRQGLFASEPIEHPEHSPHYIVTELEEIKQII